VATATSAYISDCGRYRYGLGREWDYPAKPALTFIMLNPSTADAEQDDPTIRRCIGFAKRDGFGALTVLNLYALRATDPRELERADDPKGPENDTMLRLHLKRGGTFVAAWGACAFARRRARTVAAMARDEGVVLQ